MDKKLELLTPTSKDELIFKKEIKSEKNNNKAAILMTISSFFYALQAVIHKLIFMETHAGPYFQLIIKYIGLSSISLFFIIKNKVDIKEQNEYVMKNMKNCFLRALFGMLSIIFLVFSVQSVLSSTVGIAITFVPIMTVILTAYIIGNQNYSQRDITTLALCFILSIFIINPLSSSSKSEEVVGNTNLYNSFIGLIYVILFILSFALRNIYQKLIYKLELNYSIVMMGVFVIVCCFMFAFISGENIFDNGLKEFFSVLIVMITDYISLYCNIYSIGIGDMIYVQQFFYLNLPFTCVLSMLLIGESISFINWMLILIIFLVNFYRGYLNYIDWKKESEVTV